MLSKQRCERLLDATRPLHCPLLWADPSSKRYNVKSKAYQPTNPCAEERGYSTPGAPPGTNPIQASKQGMKRNVAQCIACPGCSCPPTSMDSNVRLLPALYSVAYADPAV